MNLKPCPFCGCDGWLDKRTAIIHCTGCHIQKMAPAPAAPDDADAAVEAWNKRISDYHTTPFMEVLPYDAAVFYDVNSNGEWVAIQEDCG